MSKDIKNDDDDENNQDVSTEMESDENEWDENLKLQNKLWKFWQRSIEERWPWR